MSSTTTPKGYITKSQAGHDLEDELAHVPGRPYDWADDLIRAAFDADSIPDEAALARAITANYGIFREQPRPSPLEIARRLITHLSEEAA